MIVVGTTITAFAMSNPDIWSSWMKNAEKVKEEYQKFGTFSDIKYFAAIEVDARGLEPFAPFIERLQAIGGADKIVPNEGIVFTYQGKTFKLTGAFASLNQILGIFYA